MAETICLSPALCGFVLGDELVREWDFFIIILSWVTSTLGAVTTLRTVSSIRFCSERAWFIMFVVIAGLTFGGITVWTMHFAGMHALVLKANAVDGASQEITFGYSLSFTLTSLIAAWVISSISIYICNNRPIESRNNIDKEMGCRLAIASVLLALGACIMHYMGMVSMTGRFDMEWHAGIVILSFFIALVAASAGLTMLMVFPSQIFVQLLAASVISSAVCGMHYTGMYAVTYTLTESDEALTNETGHNINGLKVICISLMATVVASGFLHHYGEEQRRKFEFAMHRAHSEEMKRNVDLYTEIANALVNYDLVTAAKALGQGKHDDRTLAPLRLLVRNLGVYRAFLPNALFDTSAAAVEPPNKILATQLEGAVTSSTSIDEAVARLRDPEYTLHDFHAHMVKAYPELDLYMTSGKTSSGNSGNEEYQRTLGALYTVFAMFRIDIDGREVMTYGVDSSGKPAVGEPNSKKAKFFNGMNWEALEDLMTRAGLLVRERDGRVSVVIERATAMLTLTAIHDIMKNTVLLPRVQAEHSPFAGYSEGEEITDHDLALAYILEYYPSLLPSFCDLTPAQRAPVLFTQGKMNFNNGWLVQGEAPPGSLFKCFREVIRQGRASEGDVSFYFVHWITDIAGAEPFGDKPWPGAEKLTVKLPSHVLVAFLHSFQFVERLATASEVQVMDVYLRQRFEEMKLTMSAPATCRVAVQRLALMAQGFEKEIVKAFEQMRPEDQEVLACELARTSCKEQFSDAPASVAKGLEGPALLLYYGPAVIQKAGASDCLFSLTLLAAVFRAARQIFPLDVRFVDHACSVRLDAIKPLSPEEIVHAQPWYVVRNGATAAEIVSGNALVGSVTMGVDAVPVYLDESCVW
eukprot:CAMPEP_0178373800 /NCGR_PEP_ID=MMETSP0689_2-20121128/2049_1 /TAXON_ID=160604 /ORGANISM="Amphidinium massartii, Strain CS-259" /LENGTH=866 /DNA_ID=CAMNT_0019993753 /DNA_START=68 /DNA_END=2665 /DNA_ORIENTATION=-